MTPTNERAPFYHLVPKGFYQNLKWRRDIISWAKKDKERQEELWIMCSRDLLFWINTFAFIYEPRTPRVLPFITYDFQDETLLDVNDAIGRRDVGVEKSRDMGCSWIFLTLFKWRFDFHAYNAFLLYSRKEDLVDRRSDPDALMWKIDFIHKHLPWFLKPNIDRTSLKIENLDNGSSITGESTTGDLARGGRKTATLGDEFAAVPMREGYDALASTTSVSDTNIRLSTPKGAEGAYYDVMHDERSDMLKVSLHWTRHPRKNPGMYTTDAAGQLKILDNQYEFESDYPFILDGKVRSPWYDKEIKRYPVKELAAQELDIDYLGSSFNFFDVDYLNTYMREHCLPPYFTGELIFSDGYVEPKEFIEQANGHLDLWTFLNAEGEPPRDDEYAMGIDIGTGTGASDSCCKIVNRKTGETVARYKNKHIDATRFANVCVALARWFGGAYLKWEANGPGRAFGNRVIELGYRNFFFKESENNIVKKMQTVPGWWSTKDLKYDLLSLYQAALKDGDYLNRSSDGIRECFKYKYFTGGIVAHVNSVDTDNPTGERDNHGDEVIADALALSILKATKDTERKQDKPDPPEGSFAKRRREYVKSLEQRSWY